MPVDTRSVLPGGRTRLCRLASGVVKLCQKIKHTLPQFLSFNDRNLLFVLPPREAREAREEFLTAVGRGQSLNPDLEGAKSTNWF